jgi:hypothetical protein
LRVAAELVIVDVGDELPPREGGAFHAAALALADGVVVVGAATEPGEHDLVLEYRLLHELLATHNPTARRWAVLNHMPEGQMTYWSRLLRNELDLVLASQLPHDWGAASRARKRRLPLPVADRRSAASVALARVGARLAAALLAMP